MMYLAVMSCDEADAATRARSMARPSADRPLGEIYWPGGDAVARRIAMTWEYKLGTCSSG